MLALSASAEAPDQPDWKAATAREAVLRDLRDTSTRRRSKPQAPDAAEAAPGDAVLAGRPARNGTDANARRARRDSTNQAPLPEEQDATAQNDEPTATLGVSQGAPTQQDDNDTPRTKAPPSRTNDQRALREGAAKFGEAERSETMRANVEVTGAAHRKR